MASGLTKFLAVARVTKEENGKYSEDRPIISYFINDAKDTNAKAYKKRVTMVK